MKLDTLYIFLLFAVGLASLHMPICIGEKTGSEYMPDIAHSVALNRMFWLYSLNRWGTTEELV